jgi:hypothetical protein
MRSPPARSRVRPSSPRPAVPAFPRRRSAGSSRRCRGRPARFVSRSPARCRPTADRLNAADAGPLSRSTPSPRSATMPHQRQPEPGAHAGGLGGEERIESRPPAAQCRCRCRTQLDGAGLSTTRLRPAYGLQGHTERSPARTPAPRWRTGSSPPGGLCQSPSTAHHQR